MYTDMGTLALIISSIVGFIGVPIFLFRHYIVDKVKGWFDAKRKQ